MSDVFLDTVGVIALLNYSDQSRSDALVAFELLQTAQRGFVTTELVFYEAGNALARTSLRTAVDNLRIELRDQGRITALTEADCEGAWRFYRSRRPGDPGIVDCISFVVMRRLGLTTPSPTTNTSPPRDSLRCSSDERVAALGRTMPRPIA